MTFLSMYCVVSMEMQSSPYPLKYSSRSCLFLCFIKLLLNISLRQFSENAELFSASSSLCFNEPRQTPANTSGILASEVTHTPPNSLRSAEIFLITVSLSLSVRYIISPSVEMNKGSSPLTIIRRVARSVASTA